VIRQERLETLGRDVIHLSVPAGMSAVDARTRLRELAPGATVDLVHYYGLGLTAGESSKPLRGSGKISKGASAPLTIGLIDTSVASHPALNGARLVAWSAGAHNPAPTEHGTAVASLIASQGRGTIYSANIFRGPANRSFTSADVIAQALEWMIQQKVPTINMSLAGPRNAILDRLVRDALTRGFVVVAAAGNSGPTAPPAYPAAVPGVIAVTAVDKNAHVYRYANHGPYITVAAPGVDVVAANSRGGYARFTGTSFATPRVAGWIARCRTAGSSAATCKQKLRKSARDLGATGFDPVYGFGLID
jgi:subtilisin family serine protease